MSYDNFVFRAIQSTYSWNTNMRNVKSTLRRRNIELIDLVSATMGNAPSRRGWIERFRVALGMSITDLAERVGVSRPSISKLETREKDGSITIKQIDKVAEAMGGKLVYAIVPTEGKMEDIVMKQARKRAKRIIKRTRAHMALEAQSEGLQSQEEAIEELAEDLAREMARDFWK